MTNTDAKQLFEHHREWLLYSRPTYSKEAHRNLAEMYETDERFNYYYIK